MNRRAGAIYKDPKSSSNLRCSTIPMPNHKRQNPYNDDKTEADENYRNEGLTGAKIRR